MIKGPLNPKYIRAEVRIGLLTANTSRIDQVVGIEDSTQVVGLNNTIEIIVIEETLEGMEDKNSRGGYRSDRHNDYNRGRNRLRERTSTRNYSSSRDRNPSNSRSRSGSRANTNRDRIRCYNCRVYDHFTRDCPNFKEERESWKGYNKCWIWKLKNKPTDKIAPQKIIEVL